MAAYSKGSNLCFLTSHYKYLYTSNQFGAHLRTICITFLLRVFLRMPSVYKAVSLYTFLLYVSYILVLII